MTPGEGSVVHCSCHAEGECRLAFDLDMQPEESEPGSLEYTPTDGGTDEATARHLPEYMRDSIVFEAEQAPVFLQKVLVAVTAAWRSASVHRVLVSPGSARLGGRT